MKKILLVSAALALAGCSDTVPWTCYHVYAIYDVQGGTTEVRRILKTPADVRAFFAQLPIENLRTVGVSGESRCEEP